MLGSSLRDTALSGLPSHNEEMSLLITVAGGIARNRTNAGHHRLLVADREIQTGLTRLYGFVCSSSAFLPANFENARNDAGGIRPARRGPSPAVSESQSPQDPQTPEQSSLGGLTPEERQVVAELAQTDRQVRAHEQAHLAAAAGLARGVSFTFVTGPGWKTVCRRRRGQH